ncbi:MAG: transcriptional regulator [Thermoplasmataceae archaeon]
MLPDQGTLTQIMILLNIFDGEKKPSAIARSIGITVQGVQYHMKIMNGKGFIDSESNITKEGFNFLDTGLSSMRDFVSQSIARLDDVVTWEAIASGRIKSGDQVSLDMRNGYLYASTSSGKGAKGRAKNNAEDGDMVAVTSINGIIDVKIGTVSVIVLPDAENMSKSFDFKSILDEAQGDSRSLVGTIGEEAYVICRKSGIKPDLEYASIHSAFEAGVRGVSSTVLVSNRRFHYLISDIKDLQNRYRDVNVRIKYL